MDESLGEKVIKAAESIAGRTGAVMRAAEEKLEEFHDAHRLDIQVQELKNERVQVRNAMADLLIRMFDQNTFAQALLKPDYLRIKQIDEELGKLAAKRTALGGALEHRETDDSAEPATKDAPRAGKAG